MVASGRVVVIEDLLAFKESALCMAGGLPNRNWVLNRIVCWEKSCYADLPCQPAAWRSRLSLQLPGLCVRRDITLT